MSMSDYEAGFRTAASVIAVDLSEISPDKVEQYTRMLAENGAGVEGWLRLGIGQGWAVLSCSTHDGPALSETETEQFEQGYDPCVFVLRLTSGGDSAASEILTATQTDGEILRRTRAERDELAEANARLQAENARLVADYQEASESEREAVNLVGDLREALEQAEAELR